MPVFERFEWVYENDLARSSAPHYSTEDADQTMDDEAIDFLESNGIKMVVSVNQYALPEDAIQKLSNEDISYLHSPIPDFEAPTLDQLHSIKDGITKTPTLVCCGYGHGRTGTVISALQMFRNRHFNSTDEFRDNHVETDDQIQVLKDLHKELFGIFPGGHDEL